MTEALCSAVATLSVFLVPLAIMQRREIAAWCRDFARSIS